MTATSDTKILKSAGIRGLALCERINPKLLIVGVGVFFTLLTVATIQIATTLIEQAVERDAARRSLEWAEFAVSQTPQLASLAEGLPMKTDEWDEFQKLAQFGGVFRFKIFSPEGLLRFESDDPMAQGDNLGQHNQRAAEVVTSGQPFTSVNDGRIKSNRPDLYSETYLPVYDSGRLVAIAETYMDQTEKTAAVKVEYAFVGATMAGMILLALSIPSAGLWMMFCRLKLKNADLDEARVRAQASDKSKSEFISTVSHELRTPLTSIKGSLEILKSGKIIELTGKADRMLSMAVKNSNILNLLVNDLLDFERLDSGNLDIHQRSTDLVTVVKGEIETIKSYHADQNIDYIYTGEISPLFAHVDPDRIAQVVRNLLSNAVKFSPAGGKIYVSVTESVGSMRVEIKDFGCGISQIDQERIFEKFTQVDSSNTRRHSGTGLGLAISKGIIEAHHGNIGVTSIVGEGSVFYFDLPIETEKHDASNVPLLNVA